MLVHLDVQRRSLMPIVNNDFSKAPLSDHKNVMPQYSHKAMRLFNRERRFDGSVDHNLTDCIFKLNLLHIIARKAENHHNPPNYVRKMARNFTRESASLANMDILMIRYVLIAERFGGE